MWACFPHAFCMAQSHKLSRCLRLQGIKLVCSSHTPPIKLTLPFLFCMASGTHYRLVATAVYLFFMATTLLLAFYPEYIPLRVMWLLISIFFQFLALVWYNLSYIPFAREIMKNMCQTMCCKDCASRTTVRSCYCYRYCHFYFRTLFAGNNCYFSFSIHIVSLLTKDTGRSCKNSDWRYLYILYIS